MTDAELYRAWTLWLVVAGAVVLVAAALLVMIWLTARRILAEAARALRAAEAIVENTKPIWALDQVNGTAREILATVQEIERNGAALAEALHRQAGAPA